MSLWHQVLPSTRSPWEYFCSSMLASLKVAYHLRAVTPLLLLSPMTAFAFFTPASLPPACLHFHLCWIQTRVVERLPRQFIHKGGGAAPGNPPCLCCCPRGCQQASIHTDAGVLTGLAARCTTSQFVCWCLAMSVLCCHLCHSWGVPGFMWLHSRGVCREMHLPRVPPLGLGGASRFSRDVVAFCTGPGCCSFGWLLP